MTTEFKVQVEKLEGPEDWAKWKWQMGMLFEQYGLEDIIDGTRTKPAVPNTGISEEQQKAVSEWKKNNARAASLIASAVSKSVS